MKKIYVDFDESSYYLFIKDCSMEFVFYIAPELFRCMVSMLRSPNNDGAFYFVYDEYRMD